MIAEVLEEGGRQRFRLDPAASEERRRALRSNTRDKAVPTMEHA